MEEGRWRMSTFKIQGRYCYLPWIANMSPLKLSIALDLRTWLPLFSCLGQGAVGYHFPWLANMSVWACLQQPLAYSSPGLLIHTPYLNIGPLPGIAVLSLPQSNSPDLLAFYKFLIMVLHDPGSTQLQSSLRAFKMRTDPPKNITSFFNYPWLHCPGAWEVLQQWWFTYK